MSMNLGIMIGIGSGNGGGGSGSLITLAIAARGQAPITLTGNTVTSSRTRIKCRLKFRIWTKADQIAFRFYNKAIDLSAGEVVNPNAVDIIKCAVEKNGGSTTPLLFSGGRNYTMAAGEIGKSTDWANVSVNPGDLLWYRGVHNVVDVASSFVAGKLYRDTFNEPVGVETSWSYLPANEVDDVDSTGSMTAPSGAQANFTPFAPALLIGRVADGSEAIIGIGHSHVDGDDDLPSAEGNFGGGHMRRAAYLLQKPYTSFARSAQRADVVAGGNHDMLNDMLQFHTRAWVHLASNDIAGLRTAAQIIGNLRTIYGWCKSGLAGAKQVTGFSEIQRVSSTDRVITLVNQTPATGHNTGEVRDQLNTLIQGDVGTNIDRYSNIKSAVDATADGEPNKWKLRTFSALLTADATTAATTAIMDQAPELGEFILLEPGTANVSTSTNARVTRVQGTGPYTVSITNAWGGTSTHVTGSAVGASPAAGSSIGVHAEGPGNAAMAQVTAALG